jgi:aspartate aminotransferase-like enzyme
LSRANCFRIGTIGRMNEQNVRDLVAAIGRYARLKPSYVSATM